MGQKASPKSLRLKINETWKSLWFDKKSYATNLVQDISLRKNIISMLKNASVSDVIIDRDANQVEITIFSGRPGVIIGRGGAGSEKVKIYVESVTKSKTRINIVEVKRPDSDSAFIAKSIAAQMEKRIPFRRAIKQSIEKARDAGVKGIRVRVSGRLNGAEIARSEKASYGSIPLSSLNKKIDYTYDTALTTYGIVGIKVWVYKDENAPEQKNQKRFSRRK